MSDSPINPVAQPTQSVDQFLAAQIATGRASSRSTLAFLLHREGGLPYGEARRTVDAYCDERHPDLPEIREDDAGWKDELMTLASCLILALALTLMGGLFWLAYRFAVTPPRPRVVTDGPIGHTFPASPWLIGIAVALTGWLVHALRSPKVRAHWSVFRQITPAILGQSLLVILATAGVSAALQWAFPFLDRSWLYLIPGNTGRAINLALLPVEVRYVGPVYLAAFAACIPSMAHSEEVDYREGTRDWRDAVRRNLRFGLAHCVWAGVPLFVGLALMVSGFWFTHQYFRGGVDRSTVYHTTHNLIIVAVLAAVLIFAS